MDAPGPTRRRRAVATAMSRQGYRLRRQLPAILQGAGHWWGSFRADLVVWEPGRERKDDRRAPARRLQRLVHPYFKDRQVRYDRTHQIYRSNVSSTYVSKADPVCYH